MRWDDIVAYIVEYPDFPYALSADMWASFSIRIKHHKTNYYHYVMPFDHPFYHYGAEIPIKEIRFPMAIWNDFITIFGKDCHESMHHVRCLATWPRNARHVLRHAHYMWSFPDYLLFIYLWDVAEIGSWTCVLEYDISYIQDRIFIMELARGSFQDENSVPSCKKYHSLAHASKNLYFSYSSFKMEIYRLMDTICTFLCDMLQIFLRFSAVLMQMYAYVSSISMRNKNVWY